MVLRFLIQYDYFFVGWIEGRNSTQLPDTDGFHYVLPNRPGVHHEAENRYTCTVVIPITPDQDLRRQRVKRVLLIKDINFIGALASPYPASLY